MARSVAGGEIKFGKSFRPQWRPQLAFNLRRLNTKLPATFTKRFIAEIISNRAALAGALNKHPLWVPRRHPSLPFSREN
jgi:hypothetical protein